MRHISNFVFYITPIAAGIAFLVSLTLFLRPATERYLRYFSIFLLVNFLMETAVGYLAFSHINNLLSANLETTLVISFDIFLIREIVYRKSAKKVLFFIMVCYPLCALVDIFFIQVGAFHTVTYSLGCLLIVPACMYYFWELFQKSASEPLGRQPGFWICSGLLFYYCCTFPIYGFTRLMEALPAVIIQNLYIILDLVNILLYLSFSIAFLCRLKTRKSMSSF
jgi:hypothetical protein